MDVDTYKSRQALTDELRTLRQETARVKRRLVKARQHELLRRQLGEHYREVEAERAEKSKTVEALQLAELITDTLNLLKLPQQPAKAVRNLIGKLCQLT
jgi:hypothetical protein